MKLQITVLLILLSFLLVRIKDSDFIGCVQSYAFNKKCVQCYEKEVDPLGKGCSATKPANTNCAFFKLDTINNKSFCSECKPGLSDYLIPGTGSEWKCIKGTISGCVLERKIGNNPTLCFTCKDYKYAVTNLSTQKVTCQKISNSIENCLWGAQVRGGEPECYLCKNGLAYDHQKKLCVEPPQEGCWRTVDDFCQECNPYEGYSMDINQKCFKNPKIRVEE